MNKKDLADVFFVALVGLVCPFLFLLDDFGIGEKDKKEENKC